MEKTDLMYEEHAVRLIEYRKRNKKHLNLSIIHICKDIVLLILV